MLALIAAALVAGSAFAGAESKAEEEFKGLDAAAKKRIYFKFLNAKVAGNNDEKRDPIGVAASAFKIERATVQMAIDDYLAIAEKEKQRRKEDATKQPPKKAVAAPKPKRQTMKPVDPDPVLIKESYDKFDNSKSYTVEWREDADFSFTSSFFVLDSKKKSGVNIVFYRSGKDWSWLESSRRLIFLADGEKIDLGKGKHDGRVGTGFVIESISYNLPATDLAKLAKARKIEFQISGDDHVMADKAKRAIAAIHDSWVDVGLPTE